MWKSTWLWIGAAWAVWVPAAFAETFQWKAIGKYGCYGLPDAHRDAHDPDRYIITWQRYAERPAGHTVEDVKFATYDATTWSFSPEQYVFDSSEMTIMQGHPCFGFSHGKWRIF